MRMGEIYYIEIRQKGIKTIRTGKR